MLDCKDKLDINSAVEDEVKFLRGEIANGLSDTIGQPYSHVPFLQEHLSRLEPKISKSFSDKTEINRLKNAIIDENKRYEAHKNLFNYLVKTLIKFDNENKHRTPADVLVGIVGTIGRHQFGDLFDMTDSWYFNPSTFTTKRSKLFDYKQTIAVHNFFKKYFDSQVPSKMSKWADQVQHPQKSVFARDRSGYAVKTLEKSMQLFDDKLRMAHKSIEKLDIINGKLTQHVGADDDADAYSFLTKVGHGINRFVIPQREAPTGELSKSYNKQVILESSRHEIEDSSGNLNKYVLVKVSAEQIIDLDVPVNSEVWYSYKIGDVANNQMREGWYEAVSDKQIVGEKISGTQRDKKVLKDFSYMKQPPSKWFGDTAPGAANMWETIFDTRNLLESVKDDVTNKFGVQNNKTKELSGVLRERGSDEVTELVKQVAQAGEEDSFFTTNPFTGELEVPSIYTRSESKSFYFPSMYEHWVYIDLLEKAIGNLELSLNDIEAKRIENSDILTNKKSSIEQKRLARRSMDFLEKKAIDSTATIEEFNKKLQIAIQAPDTPDYDKKEMNQIWKGVHGKHRVHFTDRLQARDDKEVIRDYIYKMYQAVVSNDIRISMLETILNTDAVTAEFTIDHAAVALGDIKTRAEFGPFKYDNETVAKWVSDHYKNSDVKVTPELVHQQSLFMTTHISSVNLGMWTSTTNNFQRLNNVLAYSFNRSLEAIQLRRKGDGVYTAEQYEEFARHAGVLEPTLFFADIMSIGGGGSDAFNFIIPYKDLIRLKLSKKDFVKETDHFDKMLKNTTLRERNRINAQKGIRKQLALTEKELAELKNRKGYFHDFIHTKEQDVKKLKAMAKKIQLDIRDSYLRKVIEWKLTYFPAGEDIFTMLGTEHAMRTEDAIIGFMEARKRGMLDESDLSTPIFKQPNAVRMARLVVYNSSFGMSSQFHSKMFRGGFGKAFWQYKQYQWSQSVHDWKKFSSFIDSAEYNNILTSGPEGLYRLTKELARITGKPITGQQTRDIPAQKMIKYLLSRGISSLVSLGMMGFVPLLGAPLMYLARKITRNPFGGRAIRGTQSPILMYPLRALLLAFMLAVRMTDDEDEFDKTLKEFLMDWLPPILNVVLQFFIDPANAPRPLIPFYKGLKEAPATIEKLVELAEE